MQRATMDFPATRQGVRNLDAPRTHASPSHGGASQGHAAPVNVGETERTLSTAGGGILAMYGMARGDFLGIGMALVGASLLYRGMTGHCSLYSAMGMNTAHANAPRPGITYRR